MPEQINWTISAKLGELNNVGFQAAALVGTIGAGNAVFTLQPAPTATQNVMIFWNGTLLTQGTQDTNPQGQYVMSGVATVTFQPQAIPQAGTNIQAFVW